MRKSSARFSLLNANLLYFFCCCCCALVVYQMCHFVRVAVVGMWIFSFSTEKELEPIIPSIAKLKSQKKTTRQRMREKCETRKKKSESTSRSCCVWAIQQCLLWNRFTCSGWAEWVKSGEKEKANEQYRIWWLIYGCCCCTVHFNINNNCDASPS